MKTRSFAAKALSAVVLATTVSGYALAGDHSITADPSVTPYCNIAYGTETTSAVNGTNKGSCGIADVEIEFAGKLPGGWTYFFEIDPSDGIGGDGISNGSLSNTTGAFTAAKSAVWAQIVGSVEITKDLGNGLTLSFGDTGDGSQEDGDTWDAIDEFSGNGKGGLKVGYSKGALAASLVYGADSKFTDTNDSSINVGGSYSFKGVKLHGSYHTYSAGEMKKTNSNGKDASGMVMGASYSHDKFEVAVDYGMATEKACPATECSAGGGAYATTADLKTTSMSIQGNAGAGMGAFRPGFGYYTTKGDGRGTASSETTDTYLYAGLRWYPHKDSSGHVRVQYLSYTDDNAGTKNEAGSYSKLQIGVHTSINMLQ